jgi:hypothetical protein
VSTAVPVARVQPDKAIMAEAAVVPLMTMAAAAAVPEQREHPD